MIGLEIKLNNISDKETVNYRLVLIKGSILKNNVVCSNLTGSIECQSSDVSTSWPLCQGDFICLTQLTKGENVITLKYQGISKELTIYFTVNDTDHSVVPVYLIPDGHDGHFQAPRDTDNSVACALKKIGFGMLMIQTLFAEKLKEANFSRKSFQFEADISDFVPLCQEFRSKLTVEKAKNLSEEDLWEEIGRELMMSELGCKKRKFVCFVSSTFWDGEVTTTDPALGGGGLALLGSASLHSWPSSLSEVVFSLTDNCRLEPHLLDNSCYRGTYSGVFATSLGSAAHEIGHIFNLGHTRSGLMSRGFDNIHLVFIQMSNDDKEPYDELVPCLSVSDGPPVKRAEYPLTISPRYSCSSNLTYLEPGCAAILAHHKWFNTRPIPDKEFSIVYDKLRHVIVSEAGLRVVEVRGANGAVRQSWILKGSGKHLVIPSAHTGASFIAVDSQGNILTATV